MLWIGVNAGVAFSKQQDSRDSTVGKVMNVFSHNRYSACRRSFSESSQAERSVADNMLVAVEVTCQHVPPGEFVVLDISGLGG